MSQVSNHQKIGYLRLIMACIEVLLPIFVVSAYGKGVESHYGYVRCDHDYQCHDGFFCYMETRHCFQCYDCGTYKRKPSWRICAKSPADCGQCLAGFEEEIFHDGSVREMCIPSATSTPNSLSHPTDFYHETLERYIWGVAATVILLAIAFSVYCKGRWKQGGLHVGEHQGLPREEPPPYRSIELTTLTSNNSSVEMLAGEDVVMRVGQTKESPVQAVPFRQPDYVQPQEYPDFDNNRDSIADDLESTFFNVIDHNTPNVELLDENTMPSDWTPQQNENEMQVVEGADMDEEPSRKRSKSEADGASNNNNNNGLLNINLLINNNITIHKQ